MQRRYYFRCSARGCEERHRSPGSSGARRSDDGPPGQHFGETHFPKRPPFSRRSRAGEAASPHVTPSSPRSRPERFGPPAQSAPPSKAALGARTAQLRRGGPDARRGAAVSPEHPRPQGDAITPGPAVTAQQRAQLRGSVPAAILHAQRRAPQPHGVTHGRRPHPTGAVRGMRGGHSRCASPAAPQRRSYPDPSGVPFSHLRGSPRAGNPGGAGAGAGRRPTGSAFGGTPGAQPGSARTLPAPGPARLPDRRGWTPTGRGCFGKSIGAPRRPPPRERRGSRAARTHMKAWYTKAHPRGRSSTL